MSELEHLFNLFECQIHMFMNFVHFSMGFLVFPLKFLEVLLGRDSSYLSLVYAANNFFQSAIYHLTLLIVFTSQEFSYLFFLTSPIYQYFSLYFFHKNKFIWLKKQLNSMSSCIFVKWLFLFKMMVVISGSYKN